ncbi:unnamed protein product [Orchesella dallaii]|uniref:Uncharacterized protein n=1 Tax=Orchesella dallaii TaxID=48710 RepID=A0ABP1R7Y8_9HEXA
MAVFFILFHIMHLEDVCYFLNQLLEFEKNHISLEDPSELQFWRNRESKLATLLGNLADDSCRLLNAVVPFVAALFPDSPWNPLAALVVLFRPSGMSTIWDTLMRCSIYLECYIFWRLGMDIIPDDWSNAVDNVRYHYLFLFVDWKFGAAQCNRADHMRFIVNNGGSLAYIGFFLRFPNT